MPTATVPSATISQQECFDRDLDLLGRALEADGWVRRFPDGFVGIDAAAPEALTRPYRRLMQYGYVNGLAA